MARALERTDASTRLLHLGEQMSFLASAVHDAIRPKLRNVASILLSLFALTWLLGWASVSSGARDQVWSPGIAAHWALGGVGYSDPDWLNIALAWVHDPSRQALLRIVALAAGLAASGTALRWGPLRNGLGAELAWALLLPAIEGLGSGYAIRLAMLGFVAFIALALVAWIASWPWVPASSRTVPRRWSLGGIRHSLGVNVVEFAMFPALVPMILLWLVAAYRDDATSEPAPPTESINAEHLRERHRKASAEALDR